MRIDRSFKAFLIFIVSSFSLAQAAQKSIRDVDLKAFYAPAKGGPEGECPLHFFEAEYADLDGDGKEEAAVEAATCAMGTGGCDIIEVLKLLPSGQLKKLDIEWYEPPKWDGGMGSTPRLNIKDGKLTQGYVNGSYARRTRNVRWSG